MVLTRRFFSTLRTTSLTNTMKYSTFSGVVVNKNKKSVVVTLNRPKALNSLNLEMVRFLKPLYKQWEQQKDEINNIILKGEGNKAFCAGGDIVDIYHSGKKGGTAHVEFFAEEYQLDYLIGTLTVPHVSFLDGVTMGGGVGLSVHGKFRVATENTLFAMPETGIGFFPDVGGSYFLPRLKHSIGIYLALTGQRIKGEDILICGLATHYIPSSSLPDIERRLADLPTRSDKAIQSILDQHNITPALEKSKIYHDIETIHRLFGGQGTLQDIFDALVRENTTFSKETLKLLERMSPTSLKVTFRMMKEGLKLSFKECFELEYRLTQVFMKKHDFYEGVRAQLVDKDRNPKWNPNSLQSVSDEEVNEYFTTIPKQPLVLDTHQTTTKSNL